MLRNLALTLLISGSAIAASPTVEWITGAGGAKSDKTRAICFDRSGNVFVSGEMSEDGKFGDIEVKSGGTTDFFIAKLNPQGKFLWATNIGGKLIDRGYGVATDAAGNAYVTGHYQSTDAVVNGQTLPNAGDYDIFVAKYDPNGKVLWIRTAGGKGYDYGHAIAVDSAGDVVVSGAFVGEAKFGDVAIGSEGTRPVFCAKYSADGALKWVKASTGKVSGSGHGVAVDGANNIYIGGTAAGEGAFGNQPISSKKQGSVVIKLNVSGDAQWVALTEGGGSHEITADEAGRVWIAGMFKGEAKIGDKVYKSTGDKDNDGFVAHYSTDGKLKWSHVIQSPGTDYFLGVTTDGTGTCYATGEFSGTATFTGKTLESRGATDIQIAAFDEAGSLIWVTQVGGLKGDNAYTMAYHPDGYIAFGGGCAAPATFGSKELATSGGADLYGCKVKVK